MKRWIRVGATYIKTSDDLTRAPGEHCVGVCCCGQMNELEGLAWRNRLAAPSRVGSFSMYSLDAYGSVVRRLSFVALCGAALCGAMYSLHAQQTPPAPNVPEWALPGSATHTQVPPPAGFHRDTRTENKPIGIFQGQSDVGGAVVPGSSSYDPAAKQYTVTSAGYNIWYSRDEFRYLWKRMSGDVSLAADAMFPNPDGYSDRKAVLVIRQTLEDDSKEAVVGEHGTGMIHLAQRPSAGAMMTDEQFRFGGTLANVHAKRIGIEKHGDDITIFISLKGEPLHQFGPPIQMHFDGPFYVGIGFCSHQPATKDTAVFSDVVLDNAAGKLK